MNNIVTKNKYSQLLYFLIALFILLPISQYFPLISFLFPFGFFFIIISAINTLNFSKKIIRVFLCIAGISLFTNLINIYEDNFISRLLVVITNFVDCLFLILSIIAIYQKIKVEKKVNIDVIRGGIATYIMLGILWFLLYKFVYFIDSNAFNIVENGTENIDIQLFYYSFITLTTVGYGDISPINTFAMMLSNLEALCGQLFPAIAIGILVSLYEQ